MFNQSALNQRLVEQQQFTAGTQGLGNGLIHSGNGAAYMNQGFQGSLSTVQQSTFGKGQHMGLNVQEGVDLARADATDEQAAALRQTLQQTLQETDDLARDDHL